MFLPWLTLFLKNKMIANLINLIPLLSALFVLVLGFFIFLKRYEFKLKFLFLLLCLTAFIWLFGTFMMLINRGNEAVAIFWDRFIYLGVVFSPILFYHFSVVFCRLRENKTVINIGYILAFIFLILSRTDYFVSGLFKYQWIVHSKAQIFHHFFMVFLLIYMFLCLLNFYRNYKKSEGILKIQGLYIFIPFLLFIIISVIVFLPAYGINIIYPIPYVSGVIFTTLLFYLIFIKMNRK